MATTEPMFNVPRSVVIAAVVMIGVQLVRGFLPDELDLKFLLALAFIPARYSGAALELPGGYLTAVTSFVTYMIVHAGWVHLWVNVAWMLAFGSAVAQRLGNWQFLWFSIPCGIAGALTHLVFHFGELAPVVGASAAISGQMAAALRVVFGATGSGSWGLGRTDFALAPLPSLSQSLADPRMLAVIAVWVALNLIFGFGLVQISGADGGIAWEAHIGGFLCGLLIYGFFDKGAPALMDRAAA
jgi:membrane associated rhomboid family serine protease